MGVRTDCDRTGANLWCLHGAVGEAGDWKALQVGGRALRAVDLWRYLECRPMSLHEFGAALNAEAMALPGPNILLGYSLGGRLALHALLGPGHPWSAAVIVSAHPGLEDESGRAARRAADAEKGALALSDWGRFLVEWQAQPVLAGGVKFDRSRLRSRQREVARGFLDWSLGVQEPLWDRLAGIEVPVLWVSGERDVKFTGLAQRAVACLGKGEGWVAAGAGHRVPWEVPAAFAGRVAEFLEQTGV